MRDSTGEINPRREKSKKVYEKEKGRF